MADEKERKAPLSLSSRGKLELKRPLEGGQVRQNFSHGRSKVVQVEVRKKRHVQTAEAEAARRGRGSAADSRLREATEALTGDLTSEEKAHRLRALQAAQIRAEEEARRKVEEEARRKAEAEEAARKAEEEARRKAEEEEAARKAAEEEAKRKAEAEAAGEAAPATPDALAADATSADSAAPKRAKGRGADAEGDEDRDDDRTATPRPARPPRRAAEGEDAAAAPRRGPAAPAPAKVPPKPATTKRVEPKRRGKLTITAALDGDDRSERGRSMAAMRRAQQKERRKQQMSGPAERVVREVTVPETITVQELANRMAERGGNVIKTLMKLGVMATINQVIDADTAELVVEEFGHKIKRVSDADVEIGLVAGPDSDAEKSTRPPVVTVMGHVDHGKTSLLDAMRESDVVSGEAGGITQHIGAYQVKLATGARITFIDTPGHAAFTAMRARGAEVTDIVVLVVAANDGIMPQTIEAIRHAQAAKVPMIVAINKIDLPEADTQKVRTELLQHEVVVEEMGGDVQTVEVSAKKRMNLERLEEAILLQAELLDLKANENRAAEGAVIEAKMERGRGSVATVLIQRGTLRVGDTFVCGKEWGRVRALDNERGERLEEAGPATPVEVLGFNGTPEAGDDFIVVEDEAKAREVSGYRQRKDRETQFVKSARGSMEQMFERIQAGEAKELPVVIKGDVQGSVEALIGTLEKMGTDAVKVRVLHAAVGGINESDITLAKASEAMVIGFNVRANPQAREMARRDGVELRYYSIIYNVADDVRALLTGMLEPTFKESLLGYAQIREVFNITKVGKVGGCMVTEGTVKRGAKVRLLRDDVVIHEGSLGQLKRFKDDVREVREGYECGMSFENYNDIQVGDFIECFELEEIAAAL
ncbi:translation initiation factor IF-2 [Roseospira marina]|uniref:Translation initiation factor IF-2 n=1 Tax=Roseospira marina TaxID=140057 RepID=A0A5M6I3N4_9PROT|nr:translation initiation factor IF-2 [Roseospira marina]KAA5602820.1 translation initiation factor IF-2 [Roseospira marina]MBB4316235.1 translation initiation factor IF-2 [Roseospira marina]MBB5089406.1 translation initiation factor IF-2 [Roseospira marina]